MRVLFDGRVLDGPPSGVRDIAEGLVSGLASACGEHLSIARSRPQGHHDVSVARTPFMHLGLPLSAHRERADVIVVPRQTVPLVASVPRVPVFHDIGFLRHRQLYPRNLVRDLTSSYAARSTGVQFAVSEFTASEMRNRWRCHVQVLPIGAIHDLQWCADSREKVLLCVGAHETQKNLEHLVLAWSHADVGDASLVICGRRGRMSASIDRVVADTARTKSVRLVSGLSFPEYLALLSSCWGYIQPSLYEGLCIPALDAAAAGIPTATTPASELGVRLANSGVADSQVFSGTSVAETASVIEALLHRDDERALWAKRGQELVRTTDWKSVVDTLLGQVDAHL